MLTILRIWLITKLSGRMAIVLNCEVGTIQPLYQGQSLYAANVKTRNEDKINEAVKL